MCFVVETVYCGIFASNSSVQLVCMARRYDVVNTAAIAFSRKDLYIALHTLEAVLIAAV